MPAPKISITKHTTGLYGWQLSYGQTIVDGDISESNIMGCLSRGTSGLTEIDQLVEISYRGVHMGTFTAEEVREMPNEVAAQISEAYGYLVDGEGR